MKKLILDTETTGLHHQKDKAFALSFSWVGEDTITFLNLREKYSLGILQRVIAKAELLIGHNLKFDLHISSYPRFHLHSSFFVKGVKSNIQLC